ncbi:MAG TPA: hypothetical protein VFN67_03630 [Polyangiales bacterium]|jgi:predicted anti-sigma-YlaC factor YlaD|nr:hypothetical protein [Polyangiales bacterium]
MEHDRELEGWKNAWQSWPGQTSPLEWARKAQLAHRREERLRVSYWAALGVGALAMVLAYSRFGIVSWFRVGVGASMLLFGAGVMLYAERQLAKAQQLLAASPSGLVADLMRLHERELEGWTARRWQVAVFVVAAAGAAVVAQRIYEALTRAESMIMPIATLVAYVAALAVVALVGGARVRVLRRELSALQHVQAELSD